MQRIHRIHAHLSTGKRSHQQDKVEEQTVQQVVVVDAVRTPICRANKVLSPFFFLPFSFLPLYRSFLVVLIL